MNKRLVIRVSLLALATVFALSGCIFFVDPEALANWTADLKIEAEWDDDFGNVDMWVSYPRPADGPDGRPDTTNDNYEPLFENLYQDIRNPLDDSLTSGGDSGFFLGDLAADREKVHSGNKRSTVTYSSAPPVEMVVDNTASGREVIVVRRAPFDSTYSPGLGYITSADATMGLQSGFDYAWIGVSEVYVNGVSGNLVSSGGGSADLTVTIYNNSDSPLFEISLPKYVDIAAMSVARIHHFLQWDGSSERDYYVIVPDQRTMLSTAEFRAVQSGTVVYGNGAFGVVGSIRD